VRKTVILSLGLLVLGTPALANMLVNGDFEQPLDVGWTEDVRHAAGNALFERTDTMGQPEPGHAARVYKYLAYHASLMQVVDVPNAYHALEFDGRFRIAGGSSTCWPTAALIVSYLDDADAELGSTMFILRNQFNTWRESDTLHFVDIQVPSVWEHYELDISQEVADHLPGVNALDVRKLKLQLFSYCNGT